MYAYHTVTLPVLNCAERWFHPRRWVLPWALRVAGLNFPLNFCSRRPPAIAASLGVDKTRWTRDVLARCVQQEVRVPECLAQHELIFPSTVFVKLLFYCL